eukprot:CAMPEP_0119363172 /NCGR_PEP_ID=MMETSP1334-20130426/10067_1 /TAXON_ID=127549 /ORGANISM="Calcidiscus leptoporus, Strain RCC1130" /LENGTH=51 /DNA_ID=CAMNT_0007378543 /DNA_START=110 /DNA_END=261 /DNA_ORIENTATION=-
MQDAAEAVQGTTSIATGTGWYGWSLVGLAGHAGMLAVLRASVIKKSKTPPP